VKEGDLSPFGPTSRRLIYKADISGAEIVERCFDVLDGQTEVVNSFPPSAEKATDRRILGRWFEEFEPTVADRQECDAHALLGDNVTSDAGEAKGMAVKRQRLIEGANGDPDMIYLHGLMAPFK